MNPKFNKDSAESWRVF